MNGRLDDQANVNRKAFADQNLKIDQFASDLRVVREGVSENNVRISSLSQEMEALRLSIPQYPASAPAAVAAVHRSECRAALPAERQQARPRPRPRRHRVRPRPSPGIGMSPQRVYDTAWADYTSGQWDLCISGFDMYLRTFPRSDLADEAQFYIGECHYADGKNQEAVQAYTQVITNYPRGQSVAPAYYKRGLAFERLGQVDRARESFEAVIKSFPDSDAARLAKQNLDRIESRPAACSKRAQGRTESRRQYAEDSTEPQDLRLYSRAKAQPRRDRRLDADFSRHQQHRRPLELNASERS